MATPTTAAEWLTAIDDALYAILGGAQSYSIGNRSFTRADIGKLTEFREYWEQRSRAGGLRSVGVRIRDAVS